LVNVHLILGKLGTEAKSNEMTASPISLLDVKNAIVTIDAAGCQKDIASKTREKERQ
jgi:predicted transposase YbfD/YdcC